MEYVLNNLKWCDIAFIGDNLSYNRVSFITRISKNGNGDIIIDGRDLSIAEQIKKGWKKL